jgi:pilus assembly protein CpaB
MNRRLLTILVVAFVIASVLSYTVWRLVQNRVSTRPAATESVVAAKVDIKLGSILKAEDLTTIEIGGTPPSGIILEKDKSNAVGRGVISDLYAGEPIMDNRLAPMGSGGGLAAAIPQGMRACAVRVDEVVGVSGFATPGMHVDVLISGIPPGEANGPQGTVSRTLLQNIEVLSAGTDIQRDKEGKAKPVQVVNLLVTPAQAETLSLATNQVTIRLVLRNPLDTKTEPVPGTATANLFADPNALKVKAPVKHVAAPKAAAPPPFSIEVMNGSKQSEEKFVSPGGHQ